MAAQGAPVQGVMTDNAWAYRPSLDFQSALAALCAKHVLIKPRHPWPRNYPAAAFLLGALGGTDGRGLMLFAVLLASTTSGGEEYLRPRPV